ncbi:LacI family transcriptional regulator [Chloroflexi bacterium TSY]|nr:LacI family transcriptional regulator [Chloroflexi bacterium TSY]
MPERATILDVARLAEVSPSTVSNLLNGRVERMRPSTKERIQRAIEQLGYRPNHSARGLKTGSAPLIGLIVPSVANPFWGIFARYIEEAALGSGYQVLLGNSERNPIREQGYAEELWGHGVRGIILGSAPEKFDHLSPLLDRGLNLIAFDRPTQQADQYTIDSIGVDNVQGAYLAVNHLTTLGHRQIGLVSGSIRTVNRLDRLQGYRQALDEAQIEFNQRLIWQGASATDFGDSETMNMGRQGARELLSGVNPPTALFTINDMVAFGAYAGARELGLRVPEDVSIVGFDDIALTEVVDPPLTTIRQPVEEISRSAVEKLLARLRGNKDEPASHVALLPKLVVRSSTMKRFDRQE